MDKVPKNLKMAQKRGTYIHSFCLFMLSIVLLSSCSTSKNILYMQDVPTNIPVTKQEEVYISIRPLDVISIVVSSRDPELAALFNLPRISYGVGNATVGIQNAQNQISNYTVDEDGYIDFPVLGKIKVEGYTRKQLADRIKRILLSENLVKDPIVIVDYINLKISVLGEVNNPGRYNIDRDQITLIDAISMAGDLTIFGKRDGVMVIREEKEERTTYKIDLRSASLFTSPVYYLQQNDVIYVEPNNTRSGQSTINDNSMKSVSMWMSITSFLTTLGILLFK